MFFEFLEILKLAKKINNKNDHYLISSYGILKGF